MPEVLVLVSSEPNGSGTVGLLAPATTKMVSAIKQAILQNSHFASDGHDSSDASFTVRTIALCPDTDLTALQQIAYPHTKTSRDNTSAIAATQWLCPLTLDFPPIAFPEQAIYQSCRNVLELRRKAIERFDIAVGSGELWLPIVLTAKGPLYAEVISRSPRLSGSITWDGYQQPWHLPDRQRQPLYQFAYRLLSDLSAPPTTYLLQFGLQEDTLYFDRVLPFPAEPAIASINQQEPNLFECHWRCLTHQPILDLQIQRS